MPERKQQLAIHLFVFLAMLLLGCNLISTAAGPTPTPTAIPVGSAPTVTILWPPTGSEFAVRDEIAVHVSAADGVGITRVEMRSSTLMLASVPSPERGGQPSFDAILPWTPTRSGTHTLEIIAYRGSTASEPATLTLVVYQRAADINATPIPFGAAGAAAPASGSTCQVRIDINNLRFRSGPGTTYDILGLLNLGEVVDVTGQNAAGTWWQATRSGQTIWFAADANYSTPLGDCSSAPVVDSPR